MVRIIESLSEIATQYDAAFVDLWGCVHDGVRAHQSAIDALVAFRKSSGKVVLLTNSPRPRAEVEKQLDELGVPHEAWDTIATSGDSARLAMFEGAVGTRVFHIGTPEEAPFFEPIHLLENPAEIRTVPLDEAEGIVCTGPFDSTADPSVLRGELLYAKTKGMKLLCANPDIVVDRGHEREWCAGAVAKLYEEMGGTSLYFGKPHPPIYDLARRRLVEVAPVSDDRILCIGDGPATDIRGALGEGMDSLFITGGLSLKETGTGEGPDGQPDPDRLEAHLSEEQVPATYAMGQLR
ncbi:TIGR01459 family HAD-type hydrolase [Roseicyclus sp. F158]|uniref:TIGR01459 family HAD-type hydrolase n=1 Tax=Tropicimonas omnivorans TaxID=3075590 RepID=A0ABU3DFU9_9RHOB|nr:TIGR01459 family HAD-type hydrolase [Roseicyclus sp. F158]MDT0682585.1 TIGR01459 family HAD-type hydrolase [Roseicyclus sp. F158]